MRENEIKVFENEELGLKVRTISNPDGTICVSAEDTAIGFGWTQEKGGKVYAKWERINGFCKDLGFSPQVGKDDYIPEPLFYRLGMKASNTTAEVFQNWLAFDVIPEIRKTGSYEMPDKEKPKQKNLSSANMLVKTVSGIFKDAGVSPLYIAAEAKRLYKEQADIDINIPLITDSTMPKLYDCTEIAKEIGIMSTNGNPHIQAVSAILSKLDIVSSEIVTTAFSRNGHDDVTIQYKPSVYEKVKEWLQENNYPEKIPYVNSKGAYKTYSVVYTEVA